MMKHTFNPNTQEAEAGASEFETSLVCRATFRKAKARPEKPISKQQQHKQTKNKKTKQKNCQCWLCLKNWLFISVILCILALVPSSSFQHWVWFFFLAVYSFLVLFLLFVLELWRVLLSYLYEKTPGFLFRYLVLWSCFLELPPLYPSSLCLLSIHFYSMLKPFKSLDSCIESVFI